MKEEDLLGEKMYHVWAHGLCSKKSTSAHLRVFPGLSAMAGREDGISECDVSSFPAQRQGYERPGETQPKVLCLLGTHCLRVSVATGACDFGPFTATWGYPTFVRRGVRVQ